VFDLRMVTAWIAGVGWSQTGVLVFWYKDDYSVLDLKDGHVG